MKTRIKLFLLLGLLPLSSCDDFLALSPNTERNVIDFYNSAADFNNAIVGSYATLRAGGLYGGSLIWMGEVSTDNTDFGVTRQAGNVDNYQFIDYTYTSLNSIIYNAWRDHYLGIRRVNAIINRIESAAVSEADKNQYQAEAQFLRALFYFNLVRMFGDVPLITEEINDPDGANNLSRAPVEQIYQLIISDLTSAEQKLPATYPAAQVGRATRGAAKGLLGKVYLTRKEWDKAATKLKEVIDSGTYRLLSSYPDVFSYATPTNAEILFNVQYKSGNTGQGSNFGRSFAPWQAGATVLGPNAGTGGGTNRPTEDMDNAYEEGDSRKEFSMRSYYLNASGSRVNERYVNKYIQYGALAGDSDVDFPVLRYADVLLMYGEALNELGQTAQALPYLNQIRTRAGLEALSGLSQAEFRLAMEQERRVEFAFENQRWFDLIRTNRYLTVLRSKGHNVQDHHVLYLIPQREIDLNKALTQNPGY